MMLSKGGSEFSGILEYMVAESLTNIVGWIALGLGWLVWVQLRGEQLKVRSVRDRF